MHLQTYLLGLLAANALAAKVGEFDADKCADASGLQTCYDKAKSAYNDCVKTKCDKHENGKTVDNPDCLNQCACVRGQAQIDCAASSCWNQVYSCEYQLTVGKYLEGCPTAKLDGIPFWPPPDKAPGGCSCNIAKVEQAMYGASQIVMSKCRDETDQDKSHACVCCGYSVTLSSLPDICPNTNPAQLGLDMSDLQDDTWNTCAKTMEKIDCAKEFGYAKLDTYYKPGQPIKNGTESLSATGGSITSPVSATFTWTASNSTHIITAQSTDAKVTSSTTASATSDKSSASGSSTTSASSPTQTDAAVRSGMNSLLWTGIVAAAVFVQV
ncbi:hypothetical protein EYZ11_007113 [Aspergillus tanneri]|uniref:Extracellular membrane protein CFEM domain-containing protein n=1 Tax=Aspergillus tanneri TaxID=1220188 RepID=A0A4S3JG64_9EURO|nr:uncharacterized protein ATNIH1004_010524 [Aspergillus tanneri]KAA8643750.1 hypothetical protein ATNIH1004_010524 [Aspergillus tanneri]THC93418.1 hypothetical protein EYZ11_007113 [Aspergillus tanneri]